MSGNRRTYKKRWIGWIIVLLIGSVVASPAFAADYCISNGRYVWYEWIDSITVEESTHVSGANGGYADFTDEIHDLSFGDNEVTLTPGFGYSAYLKYWRIWVDVNQDSVFDDSELLLEQASDEPVIGQISIPDTASQNIVDAVDLPDSEPIAMAYSAADNALYIVSGNSAQITVFDIPTASISQIPFSEYSVGRDIAVAPSLRLLFVLSPNGYDSYLNIVDMDTGTIELETAVGGASHLMKTRKPHLQPIVACHHRPFSNMP